MGQLDIEKGLGSETRSPIGKNKFSSGIPLCVYLDTHVYMYTYMHTSSLSIHLFLDTQVASTSWLLKQHCYEYWDACMFLNDGFAQIYAPKWNSGSYDKAILVF